MIVFVQTKWVTAVIAMRSQVTFYLQVRTCSCLVSMIYLHISELVRTKNSEILRKFMLNKTGSVQDYKKNCLCYITNP